MSSWAHTKPGKHVLAKRSSRCAAVQCMQPPEKELQDRLIQTAKLSGWMVFHDFDSRRSDIGFMDLTMVRRTRR